MDVINWDAEPDLERLERLNKTLDQSPAEAVPELEELVAQGSAVGALYLGSYYLAERKDKLSDEAKAAFWYEKAHVRGIGQASYMLGRLRYRKKDFNGAFEVFRVGADRLYLPAMYRTAKMYQDGEGVPADFAECVRLLQLAEAEGHIFSRRDLAGLMVAGKLGPAAIPRGVAMLAKLTADMAWMIKQIAKPGSIHSERVLA
jgi:TPR repeat protein